MTTESFEELYQKHFREIFNHCQNIVQNREVAEDRAQETFIKAYNNFSKYNSQKGNFRNWIFKIATNTCLDFLKDKRHKIRKQTQSLDEESFESDGSQAPDKESEDQQLKQFIEKCLKNMSVHERVSIWLYHVVGFTLLEIAQIFRKSSPNTSRKWINDGGKKLKKCLENKGVDEEWVNNI